LLLEPIAGEGAAGHDRVAVAAERLAHQRQVESSVALRLPDVGHLVDEEALQPQRLATEIFRPKRSLWMEMDVAAWRHCCILRLKRPPFAADKVHPTVIDRVTEDGTHEFDFAGSERA